jgi:hypothetical protein
VNNPVHTIKEPEMAVIKVIGYQFEDALDRCDPVPEWFWEQCPSCDSFNIDPLIILVTLEEEQNHETH